MASNFEFLINTLKESRERELDLEERKLKLEEACLAFEHEKWQAQQQEDYREYAEVVFDPEDEDAMRFAESLRKHVKEHK